MPWQVRYRVSALVLGGLILGAPLLINGTASADQVPGGGRQVVFDGGVLGFSCRSQPEVGSLTVPADSTVRVVNRTGHDAQLRLGGAEKATVPDDGATEVVFRRGTTAVQLSPACSLGDEGSPLLVTAMPTDPATIPGPSSSGTDDDASAATDDQEEPQRSVAGSALPDAVTPGTRPQRPVTGNTPGAARTTPARPNGAASASGTMPQGGSAATIKTKDLSGTATRAHAFSGMPPGDDKALLPGVPTLGLSQSAEPPPALAAAPPTDIAAAEPVATVESLPESRPAGLLALAAIVCVLGVAVGAIRAIVSQRASRTTIA